MRFIRESSRNTRIIIAVCILLVLFGLYEYWRWHPRKGTTTFIPQYEITLKNYDGKDVRLKTFKREPLVVYAWASWCVYCEAELRNLVTIKKKYGDTIEIVAPNRAESLTDARLFTDKLNSADTITFLLDPQDSYYKSIGGYAMPETLFVNDRGEIVFRQRGPMSLADMEVQIKTIVD